jgi:hypothetical protein
MQKLKFPSFFCIVITFMDVISYIFFFTSKRMRSARIKSIVDVYVYIQIVCGCFILRSIKMRLWWLSCIYFILPTAINPTHIQ